MNKEELMRELASPLEIAQASLRRLDDTLALAKVVHSRQEQDQLLEQLSEEVLELRSALEDLEKEQRHDKQGE